MVPSEVVGGQLGRHTAPAECHACADHRDVWILAPQPAQQVRQHARQPQRDEHERDRQLLAAVVGLAGRRRQRRADHPDDDRPHREVLIASRALVEHPFGQQHQHEQARRERRLDDHQRRQQQRHDLQWPAEDREARAEQPARALGQIPRERETQVVLARGLLGVHRLQGDP